MSQQTVHTIGQDALHWHGPLTLKIQVHHPDDPFELEATLDGSALGVQLQARRSTWTSTSTPPS